MRRRMRVRRQTPETIQWPNRRRIAPFVVIGSSILLLLVTFKMVPKAENNYPVAPDGLGNFKPPASFNQPQSPEQMLAREKSVLNNDEDEEEFARVRFDGPRNYRSAKRNADQDDEEMATPGHPQGKPEILLNIGRKAKKIDKSQNDLSKLENETIKTGSILISKLISSTQSIGDKDKDANQPGEPELMLVSKEHGDKLNPKLLGPKINPEILQAKPGLYRADLYRERKIKRAKAMAALRRKQ